jgi:hypothetical protein
MDCAMSMTKASAAAGSKGKRVLRGSDAVTCDACAARGLGSKDAGNPAQSRKEWWARQGLNL